MAVAMVYGIPALINFLLVRFFFANERVGGTIILGESISKIMEGTRDMIITSYGLLPEYLFLTVAGILVLFTIYKAIKEETKLTKKTLKIAGVFYLIAGTLLATIVPQILQDTSAIWFVARSSYPTASIVGLIIWYFMINWDIKEIAKNILVVCMTLFLIIQLKYFITFTIDNYIGNYMDYRITTKIEQKIQEYEEQTGNTIDSIAIYQDAAIQYAYPGLAVYGDMNIKAYSAKWCIPSMIKLYTNRTLEMVKNKEEYQEKFSKEQWNSFDEEQIIFEDNVMHLCMY